jgi:L-glyceraldehyde 3-phosphate reductase
MPYRSTGRSGLRISILSLGLWHNFGRYADYDTCRRIVRKAFDHGINHFDLANNYGPPPGAAEITFGRILADDLAPFRDEITVTTKAGYLMWPGPYGDGGSRKYLLASLDQSLKRMGLEYVDVFYHHRPDLDTPMEESMMALDHAVRSGKALYAGISNYNAEQTRRAAETLNSLGTPLLVHQPRYSLMDRQVEKGLLQTLHELGVGCVVFSPLAQGLLTDKYLSGIPSDSRAARSDGFLARDSVTPNLVVLAKRLSEVAEAREQTLAQMALSWVLRHPAVTSAIIGVRTLKQLEDNLSIAGAKPFENEELERIERILATTPRE